MDKPNDLIHSCDGSMDDLPAFLRSDWEGNPASQVPDEQQPDLHEEPEIYAQVRIIGIGEIGTKMVEVLQRGRLSALAKFLVLSKEDELLVGFIAKSDLVVIVASLNEAIEDLAQWVAKTSKEAGALTLRFSEDSFRSISDGHTNTTNQLNQFEVLDASVTYYADDSDDDEDRVCHLVDPIAFHAVANLVIAVNVQGVICVDYYDIKAVFDSGHYARFAYVLAAAGADPATRLEQVLESGRLSRELAGAKRILVAMSASEVPSTGLETIYQVMNIVRRHCRDDAQIVFSMNELTECAPGTFSVGVYTVGQ